MGGLGPTMILDPDPAPTLPLTPSLILDLSLDHGPDPAPDPIPDP